MEEKHYIYIKILVYKCRPYKPTQLKFIFFYLFGGLSDNKEAELKSTHYRTISVIPCGTISIL